MQGEPVAWLVPEEGLCWNVNALWVTKILRRKITYWAMKYIDFALSKEAQENWCGEWATAVNNHAVISDYMKDDLPSLQVKKNVNIMVVVPSKVFSRTRKNVVLSSSKIS